MTQGLRHNIQFYTRAPGLQETSGHRTRYRLPNTNAIEAAHGQDAFAGARDERLVRIVDIVGGNICLTTRDAEFLSQFD